MIDKNGSARVTTESVVERLRPPLVKVVESVLAEADSTQSQIADLSRQISAMGDAEGASGAMRQALASALENLESAKAESEREVKKTIATAMVVICNELRVPVALKKPAEQQAAAAEPAKPAPGKSNGRMTREEKETYLKRIVRLANDRKRRGISRSEIAEELGLKPANVSNLLRQLQSDARLRREGESRDSRYFPA